MQLVNLHLIPIPETLYFFMSLEQHTVNTVPDDGTVVVYTLLTSACCASTSTACCAMPFVCAAGIPRPSAMAAGCSAIASACGCGRRGLSVNVGGSGGVVTYTCDRRQGWSVIGTLISGRTRTRMLGVRISNSCSQHVHWSVGVLTDCTATASQDRAKSNYRCHAQHTLQTTN